MLVKVISFYTQGSNGSTDLSLSSHYKPVPGRQAYSHSAFTEGLSFELLDQEAVQSSSKVLTGDSQIHCTDVPVNLCNRYKVE